jgi:uncharacterized protein YggT (Ycf19 family)
MSDDKVLVDEARRKAQHQKVKAHIQQDVDAEIEARADRPAPSERAEVDTAVSELRGRAVGEVVGTEREVQRGRSTARVAQFVDYGFGIIYALLGIRLILALVAARPGAAFVQWITAITDPLYAPFRGILPNLTSEGGYTLVLPVLFAILMYAVLHAAVRGLLKLIGERRTHV